jgi:hypothetical protein
MEYMDIDISIYYSGPQLFLTASSSDIPQPPTDVF